MPGDQPRFQLDIDLEIQPLRHEHPPHRAGETYYPARTNLESMTPIENHPNPEMLAGDRGLKAGVDSNQYC